MMEIRLDTKEVEARAKELGDAAKDGTRPLSRFYNGHWKPTVGVAWGRMRAQGGDFRGHRWAGFKDQYTRKTDGQVVPAQGQVPRLDKRGNVKGKKRPSGQRVTAQSILVQDTGHLRGKVVADRPKIQNRVVLLIGDDLPNYAEHQFKTLDRDPLFFTSSDERVALREGERYLDELAQRFNR